jgi:hypothetical protein
VKSSQDTLPFHPYYTMKDAFAIVVFLMFFAFVFFAPNYLGHADNYEEANPLVTPAHIVPEWYYLPFYAILRAVPDKLGGVIAMFASILILFALPWLDTSQGALGQLTVRCSRASSGSSRGLRGAWLSRREAGGRALCDRLTDPDHLLLRALPGDPAAARIARESEAAAVVDLGRCACQETTCHGCCACRVIWEITS